MRAWRGAHALLLRGFDTRAPPGPDEEHRLGQVRRAYYLACGSGASRGRARGPELRTLESATRVGPRLRCLAGQPRGRALPWSPMHERSRAPVPPRLMTPAELDAYVLCGGLGTRLGSAADGPKPLARVGGRAFLDILLAWLSRDGVQRFVLCAGYRADAIEAALPALSSHGEVSLAVEADPLGTGGGLRDALPYGCSDPLLALNGDSICPVSLGRMLASHQASSAVLTIAGVPAQAGSDQGTMWVAADGRVTSFAEKARGAQGDLVNAGVYLINRRPFRDRAPAGRFSLEHDLFPALVCEDLVRAWVHEGSFVDIGTPERYRDAARDLRQLALL